MTDTTALTKDQLRKECRRIRATLPAETCRQASQTICRYIQSWHIFTTSTAVFTYLPMQNEIDLTSLLYDHPKKNWGIPRIHSGGQMVFHAYDPSRLRQHRYGMLEPDLSCPIIPSEAAQLVLVPGLAFDSNGWRLGYGGGFFDRFLSQFTGSYAGITYQLFVFKEIPHTSYDIPMQFVITEEKMIDILNPGKM